MKKINYLLGLSILAGSLCFTSCGDDDEDDVTPVVEETVLPATVVDIAASDENFSSLVAALQKADLVSTLQGAGPFTVFAPTNEAFATFLSDNNFAALDDVPTDVLTDVLLNHVVSANVLSTSLSNGYVAGLSTGPGTTNVDLYVNIDNGVTINGANVTTADIQSQNGVVHVIDKVIASASVVDIALQNSDFSILVQALTRDDLTVDFVSILSGTGPFTVFAPTNAAFEALLVELDVATLADIDVATLEAVLKYHVVSGANVDASTLTDDQIVSTFLDESFTIDLDSGAQIIDGRNRVSDIVLTDVQGSNGIVHVINKVILPPVSK